MKSRRRSAVSIASDSQDDAGKARASVKLADVAKLSGFSLATASRALNGYPTVGKEERDRVLKAASELGYVPNGSARALRSTRTRLVGAIIPTLDHAIYAMMVNGLESKLAENNVSLIVNTSGYDLDIEFRQARLLIERGVESIVLVGAEHLPETTALLKAKGVGFVYTYTHQSGDDAAAIGFDNHKVGASAARYLHDLGHKKFAMIAGVTAGNDRATGRRDGFLTELETLGHDPSKVFVAEAAYDLENGRHAMSAVLRLASPPTAVFCGSDILAAGALKYCQSQGIDVPGDISVMGVDNLEVALLTTPELTTLEVPAKEMGVHAADYAMANTRQRSLMHQRELPVRLIVRGSTARPASGKRARS